MEKFYCGANLAERRCAKQCEACAKVQQTKVFIMVPHYWALATSEQRAWEILKEESGETIKALKAMKHFAMEFPADVKVDVHEVDGSWHASRHPVRVVSHKGFPPERIKLWESLCRQVAEAEGEVGMLTAQGGLVK